MFEEIPSLSHVLHFFFSVYPPFHLKKNKKNQKELVIVVQRERDPSLLAVFMPARNVQLQVYFLIFLLPNELDVNEKKPAFKRNEPIISALCRE